MTRSRKTALISNDHDEELLDEIERLVFKAKAVKRPFLEFLLRLALLEALESVSRKH